MSHSSRAIQYMQLCKLRNAPLKNEDHSEPEVIACCIPCQVVYRPLSIYAWAFTCGILLSNLLHAKLQQSFRLSLILTNEYCTGILYAKVLVFECLRHFCVFLAVFGNTTTDEEGQVCTILMYLSRIRQQDFRIFNICYTFLGGKMSTAPP